VSVLAPLRKAQTLTDDLRSGVESQSSMLVDGNSAENIKRRLESQLGVSLTLSVPAV